ncbi:MAG: hypothetical protein U5O39_04765 [Gammaproteobacteria bacterium]|nr:hypothetical protein [Gammaproteobacteria bacterium]
MTSSSITVVLDGVMAVTTLTLMFLYSPMLTMIVVVAMAIYLTAQLAFYSPTETSRRRESIAADARVGSPLYGNREVDGGDQAIQASSRVATATGKIDSQIPSTRGSGSADCRSVSELVDSAISGISHVLVIFIGASIVLDGEMSIGMLYAFLAYRNHMTSAVTSLVG